MSAALSSIVMRAGMVGCLPLLLLLTACGHVRGLTWEVKALQVGPGAPAKPPTCPVRQEFLTPKEAQDRYRQVGVLCHVGGRYWGRPDPWDRTSNSKTSSGNSSGSWAGLEAQTLAPAEPGASTPVQDPVTLLDDVRADACRLGGEIIVRHGFCGIRLMRPGHRTDMQGGVEFGVYDVNSPTPVAAD